MSIQTVLGPISKHDVGLTLMHEHIFMDLRQKFVNTSLRQSDEPVSKDNVAMLRKNHRALKDNLFLNDEATALAEIREFKRNGGATIVSMSNRGMGQDPEALRRISREIGINIVECTGYYTDATHPEYMWEDSPERMADRFIRDIEEGIDDTGVRAGIIGEIGTSAVITEREWRVLRAACIAQRATGAAVSIHIDPWVMNGLDVLEYMEKNGGNVERIVIDHVDAVIDLDYCRKLIGRGALIEFDNFGKCYETPGLHFDTDEQRVEAIRQLVSEGREKHILISTDICLKTDLYAYGGGGYGHIPRTVIPMMRVHGIPQEAIAAMTVSNPERVLDR